MKQGIQGYAAWASETWMGDWSRHPGPRRKAGVWVCRETRAPPWLSAILSPRQLLHQHRVLSSHSFERRVQRPGFLSWPCLLAQGTSSLWT